MRRFFELPVFFILILNSQAQSSCPDFHFKNPPSANLNPAATTRLNLARQADGSYTAYETANTSPYGFVSASPHFEKQLTACLPPASPAQDPAPLAPTNPIGAPSQMQAVAVLKSGNYLIVTPSSSTGGIDAAVFDPRMNLVSVTNYPFSPGVGEPSGIGLADFNGDGNLDIAYITTGRIVGSPQPPSQLTILLGNGGSSFQAPVAYPVPPHGGGLSSFAIGDLNGDHKLDIAITVTPFGAPSGNIVTFLGTGDGTFQAGPSTAVAQQPVSIAIGDLNGDGKQDLAVTVFDSSVQANSVAVALGNGDGTFQSLSNTQVVGDSLTIGDMNSDGIPDIATAGTILFGDGNGLFPKRQDYYFAASGSVILTDFDGDGRIDVVIAGGTPGLLIGLAGPLLDTGLPPAKIIVLFGQPDGTFFGPALSVAPGLAQANTFITDLRSADFNDDGVPDLVYAGEFGIGAMLGNGDGTFASSFSSLSPPGWEIATGDFDGDGKQDIVSAFAYAQGQPGALTFFAGKGDGTFQAPLKTTLPPGPAALVAGDFNGDGKLDLAVLFSTESSGTSDAVTIFFGNGDGSFHQGASYPAPDAASWLLAGDLNNDGKPDLVVSGSASVSTLVGKGDGTFVDGAHVSLAVTPAGDAGSSTMALADFNRDGKLDLAVAQTAPSGTAGFAILLGKGDGTFQKPLIDSLGVNSLAAADLNRDGTPDLMAVVQLPNGGGFRFYCLVGNGDGSFQPPVDLNLYPADSLEGAPMILTDLNRDGAPDLVSPALPEGFFSLMNLTSGPPPFQMVSSASFTLGPLAANSFVSAFGAGLPSSLAGLSIEVTDSAHVSRSATPIFASATQVNFVMPAGASTGVATVSMMSPASATPLTAQVEIVPMAPGLFTENPAGLAAAYAIRVDAHGNQSYLPVFNVQNGSVVATPIDLGPATDQVYLILFGTGFDAALLDTVSVTIAGQAAQATYAGPQALTGLDQVNVLLPHQLAGSGNSPVELSIAGSKANTVHIAIQ